MNLFNFTYSSSTEQQPQTNENADENYKKAFELYKENDKRMEIVTNLIQLSGNTEKNLSPVEKKFCDEQMEKVSINDNIMNNLGYYYAQFQKEKKARKESNIPKKEKLRPYPSSRNYFRTKIDFE